MRKPTIQSLRYAISLPARVTLAILWPITVAIARTSNRAEWIIDDTIEKIKACTAWE